MLSTQSHITLHHRCSLDFTAEACWIHGSLVTVLWYLRFFVLKKTRASRSKCQQDFHPPWSWYYSELCILLNYCTSSNMCDTSPMCGSYDQPILGSMCLSTQTVLQPMKCHNAWHLGNPNTPKITHTMPACSGTRCIHIHPRWDCLWVDVYSKTMQEGHLRASLER